MAQKIAVLDLGTNTFNLLLATVTPSAYYIFRNEKIPVKLGKGGINEGWITKEAQERALEALTLYKEIIDSENIVRVYGYATSAFRNTSNGEALRDLIEQRTGIKINIISGEVEAEFIYKGVKTAIDVGGDPALIMDIGGGSVEFLICDRDQIFWKRSYEMGAQRLLDWFHIHDPIPPEEVKKLDSFFRKELASLKEQIDFYKPTSLIGSSGTFDTLSEIHQHHINRFLKGDEKELPLTIRGFKKIYLDIITKNKLERLQIPGMIEMRVDMIVVAACLVKFVLAISKIDQIRVSAHSLKEGMIYLIQQEMNEEESLSASNN